MRNESLPDDDQGIAELFEELAVEAGRILIAIRAEGYSVRSKADDSPVTEADMRAEAAIRAGLARHLPGTAIVAEEEIAAGRAPKELGRRFILVDAMDGTREFIAGRPDFTVNIALIEAGVPRIGVVSAPAHRLLYVGRPGKAERVALDADGVHGDRQPIAVQPRRNPPRILASRSHRTAETDAFLQGFPGAEVRSVGSSLKFCLVAAGEADLYPRFGPTMEWDTAAGDAVLRAAGGVTTEPDGTPLTYGKRGGAVADFSNPWFIARGA